MELEYEFDEDFKKRLIGIIKASLSGRHLSNADAIILFHWVHHVNDKAYEWVPEKYKKGLASYNGGNK